MFASTWRRRGSSPWWGLVGWARRGSPCGSSRWSGRSYRDGCWVVPLAEVAEPELLSAAVAEALGLQAADRPWDVETLADYIADRTALLVLDNCEHLVAAVGDLVKGLRATCPNLRFLLTSRRPLGLSGEDVIVVPPLSVPDEATVATPEAIAHYEAVNLFVDRATSARADFRVTPDNAPAVAGLCRDLDGMPLAIELAAARIRVMSPEEIRDSLAERAPGAQPRLPRRRRPAPVTARLRRVVLPTVHRPSSRGSGRGPRCSPGATT